MRKQRCACKGSNPDCYRCMGTGWIRPYGRARWFDLGAFTDLLSAPRRWWRRRRAKREQRL